MRCVYHRGAHSGLARLVVRHGARLGTPVRLTRHTPGILVDSSVLARAGLPAVTLSRVSFGTLNRIHTPADVSHRLSGEGTAQAARIMTGIIEGSS